MSAHTLFTRRNGLVQTAVTLVVLALIATASSLDRNSSSADATTGVGVPQGVSLTPSKPVKVTGRGAIVDGRAVDGSITVLANNVTIKRTRVVNDGYYAIRIAAGVTGTIIEDVDIVCASRRGTAWAPAGYTARRVRVTSCKNAFLGSSAVGVRVEASMWNNIPMGSQIDNLFDSDHQQADDDIDHQQADDTNHSQATCQPSGRRSDRVPERRHNGLQELRSVREPAEADVRKRRTAFRPGARELRPRGRDLGHGLECHTNPMRPHSEQRRLRRQRDAQRFRELPRGSSRDDRARGRGPENNADASVAPYGIYTLSKVNVHGFRDGVKLGSNQTVEDSWVHDLWRTAGSHNDGMQSVGGRNVKILRNNIEGPWVQSTSALILGTGGGGVLEDYVIEGNETSGGTYTVYIGGPDGDAAAQRIKVRNNVFVNGSFVYGPLSTRLGWPATDSGHEWSGNVFSDGTAFNR